MKKYKFLQLIGLILCAGLLAACGALGGTPTVQEGGTPIEEITATQNANNSNNSTTAVTGQILLPDETTVPENAILTVRLVEITRSGPSAAALAEQTVSSLGAAPWAFRLEYDSAALNPNATYGVQAELTFDGSVQLRSADVQRVITNDNPTTGIALNLVRG